MIPTGYECALAVLPNTCVHRWRKRGVLAIPTPVASVGWVDLAGCFFLWLDPSQRKDTSISSRNAPLDRWVGGTSRVVVTFDLFFS